MDAVDLELLHAEPVGPRRPTPILFVHGAWHAAWCWAEQFMPHFSRAGYECYALSLRGHGASPGREHLRWTTLTDYVADVAAVTARLPARPVIVAHSMGGAVVQRYLETGPAAGVVLMASVPPRGGALFASLRALRRHPRAFLKMNLSLSLYPLVGTPRLARDMLFSPSLPESALQSYFPRLQDEAYRAFLDMIAIAARPLRPARVPALVLGAGNDRLFSTAEVETTASVFGTRATIYPDMAHDMMLDTGWQTLADQILAWLREQRF